MDLSEFSRLTNKNLYARHPWETSRAAVLQKLLKRAGLNFPVNRIVDIGAGDAFVINHLLVKGFAKEYVAIDIAYTPQVVSQLKQNYSNSPVRYLQSLRDYQAIYNDDVPTLYLCMDVLEHLENEGAVLSLIKQGNNTCFFAVPAFQELFSEHDVLLGHYRRYSLAQLEKVLTQYGFTVKDKGYYFTSLLAVRWIEKLLKKEKNESIDNWGGGKAKTGMLNLVLRADFAFSTLLKKVGINIVGLSCYCLCKK